MISGEISLEAPIIDLVTDLVIGRGGAASTLRFQAANGNPAIVMNEADSLPATRCEACGYFMILTDSEYTDTECLVCRAAMPAGTTACPKCGWTYKEK